MMAGLFAALTIQIFHLQATRVVAGDRGAAVIAGYQARLDLLHLDIVLRGGLLLLDSVLDQDIATQAANAPHLDLGLSVLEDHRLVLRLRELLIELALLLEFTILREVVSITLLEHVELRGSNVRVQAGRLILQLLLFVVELITGPQPLGLGCDDV